MTVCILGLTFTSVLAQEISIPTWIKNNAGWWANDQIPDSAFVQGIEYLIKVGIIIIGSPLEKDKEIVLV